MRGLGRSIVALPLPCGHPGHRCQWGSSVGSLSWLTPCPGSQVMCRTCWVTRQSWER